MEFFFAVKAMDWYIYFTDRVILISFFVQSLNFGIDFRGGRIRTESSEHINVAAYRNALSGLDLGDITISEVFDPSSEDDQNVTMIRIRSTRSKQQHQYLLKIVQSSEVSEDIKFVSVGVELGIW